MRVPAIALHLILVCSSVAQTLQDTTLKAERREPWVNFPGIGFRFAAGKNDTEVGLYGQWMVARQRKLGSGLTAFGPELSLSAVFAGDRTYRRGTVGIRAMHLFHGAIGPCGGISFDNISYRAALDDTRLTLHAGITLIDFVTVEYARTTPLTSTELLQAENLVLVRLGLNGAVLLQLFEKAPIM
ncbi:MAG: hypothetical protein IPJ76_10690 [Flavobacteriales bacterium]|nr:MAG: hypothetical protein IPJ76_10690 [Flavobacteriales bacterium]